MIGSFGTISYDSSKIDAAKVPTSFADFAKPQWKSKLILTYPNDDDAICYLFSMIVGRYGFQWLYDLAKNDVQWVRGTASPGILLADLHNKTSSRVLTFTSYPPSTDYFKSKKPQAPEQYMSWAQTAAIIKSTPRPESAKLYMNYLVGLQRQNGTAAGGSPSMLLSLNKQYGLDPYSSNATQISGFRVFEQDRNQVEWWKNLFEEVLGTAQGPGPLLLYPNPS